MTLTEIYEEGEKAIRARDFGIMLDGVETEFVLGHNRRVLDRFTFRQQAIDAVWARTECKVLGVSLKTPVVMSAMTMPIPAIAEHGLEKVAQGLKETGSLLWTGTPIPSNLKDLVAAGPPVAANVKPLKDRKMIFQAMDQILDAGVRWLGVEIDSGQGTKIGDRQMASDCAPLTLKELKEIRKRVPIPLIFKGVLSRTDAEKSVDAGADGIVVSNHGAHTLDYLPHPFQVMDEIMEVVRDNTVVIVDGGFRRGSDVLKGLAFGASLVGLGRPILYGLAAAGDEGVKSVVKQITGELQRIMSMVGASEPNTVGRNILIE